jgi:phage repressor protein C with HTH and peptisase S24 domain
MEKSRSAFGLRLYQARKKAGLTQKQVAARTGISQGTLSELETDAQGSSYTALLAQVYGVSAIYLAEGVEQSPVPINTEESSDFIAVQRADFKLSAGVTGYSIELLNGDRAPIFFRKDWLDKRGYNPAKLHAIAISGQSMETSMYDGDIVVVNVSDTKPADGEVFAANYEGELVVKRMVRENGNWYLSSDNQDKRRFPNKLCHEDCFIIGRVIYKQSERI